MTEEMGRVEGAAHLLLDSLSEYLASDSCTRNAREAARDLKNALDDLHAEQHRWWGRKS